MFAFCKFGNWLLECEVYEEPRWQPLLRQIKIERRLRRVARSRHEIDFPDLQYIASLFPVFAGGFRATSTAKIWVPVSPRPLEVVSEKA